jgi:ketosteroid isomerase-like protein
MKQKSIAVCAALVTLLFAMGFQSRGPAKPKTPGMSLYDSIVAMDKKWEDAYNNCKLEVMEELISEDLEFYHDQGGLMTSKKKLNEALKNNICGKVKRELKSGSIEVYEIKGYGAVEMGLHGFLNINQQGPPDHYSKFVHLWKREGGSWKITRVISLH